MPDSVGRGTTAPWTRNLVGPGGRLFGDPSPGPDETAFQVDNTSDAYYNSPYYKQHENDVEPMPVGCSGWAASASGHRRRRLPGADPRGQAHQLSHGRRHRRLLNRGDLTRSHRGRRDGRRPDRRRRGAGILLPPRRRDLQLRRGRSTTTTSSTSPSAPTTGRSSRSPVTTTARSPTQTAARSPTRRAFRRSSPTSVPRRPRSHRMPAVSRVRR